MGHLSEISEKKTADTTYPFQWNFLNNLNIDKEQSKRKRKFTIYFLLIKNIKIQFLEILFDKYKKKELVKQTVYINC